MYKPPKKLWPQIAPTEIRQCNLRHRLVQGEVHDENAYAIGGVSGHAGVFSTSPDLAAFCQMLLNGGVYAHQRILKRATIAEFTAPQPLAKRHANTGLGGADRRKLERTLFFSAQLWPHGLHGHFDLDRSRPPAICRAAHKSRESDARESQNCRSPPRGARCGDAGSRLGDGNTHPKVT